VFDTASGQLRLAHEPPQGTSSGGAESGGDRAGEARMYVCGITPYDATHLGHAATYVAFDLLHRAWLD